MIDTFKLKVGCTYLPKIMASSKSEFSQANQIELMKLQSKSKLTEIQSARLRELLNKKATYNPKNLSVAAKEMLRLWVIQELYGRRYEIRSEESVDHLVKGTKTENNAFSLLNERFGKGSYKRVKIRLNNEYLTGIIDGIDAPTIDLATKIVEVKTCFSVKDFMREAVSEIKPSIYWQCQGYMALTGKEVVEVAHVLTAHPEEVIQEQHKLLYDELCPDGEVTERFIKQWDMAYKHMTFEDIPINERILVRRIERDEEAIAEMPIRIEACWQYMAEFQQEYLQKFR